jgi:glycosyltransferase involved in cell wall biosynthesis
VKVLLIAEAANPEWVSVPAVGWQQYLAMSRMVDTHLVTQVRNRDAIQRFGLAEGRFTAIDSEAVARPVWRLTQTLRGGAGVGWTTGMAVSLASYLYFERLVWKRFGPAIRAGEYDLVHRLTPLSPTMPSPMAGKCARAGVPFVLGPLNGGIPWPRAFDAARRQEKEWLSYIRGVYKLAPYYRATRRHAAAIIAGSKATLDEMPARHRGKCVYIPENAVDPGRFRRSVEGPVRRPLRAVFVGRLVPYKGADMLVEAAAPLVRAGLVKVDIIGDGPQGGELEAMVRREGLEEGVRLGGWVEQSHLQDRLVESDVLAFPSVREFGGAVVLEAMMLGLVPIVVNYGGPGELVTDSTGYRVPLGSREEIITGFRARLEALTRDPGGLREMGARARARVMRSFTWEAKAGQVVRVYNWALGRGERPTEEEFFAEADGREGAAA